MQKTTRALLTNQKQEKPEALTEAENVVTGVWEMEM